MKAPRSLKITDIKTGVGPEVVPGDLAACEWRCTQTRGEVLFASDNLNSHPIRVGARDSFVAIEYGLLGMQVGGTRRIVSPPNLNYVERQSTPELSERAMLIYEITLINIAGKWDADMAQRLFDGSDA